MKHCNKCDKTKPLAEFSKRKEKWAAWCKPCFSAYNKKRWSANSVKLNKRKRKFDATRKQEIELKVIEYLKANPCVSCGETNLLVLDFDHLGNKEFNIAKAIWSIYSWSKIDKEIKKCQVLCSNCHRIKTAHQLNTWKLKYI
jgi:hypothetical protein